MLRHNILDARAPDPPPVISERVTYAQLRSAALFDSSAFRVLWKVMGMICRPDEVYADPHIVRCTREVPHDLGSAPPMVQPTREQLLAALTR
jgi:hypothetical protein